MTGISIKAIKSLFVNCVKDFFRGSRVIIFAIMLIFIYLMVIGPLKECADMMNGKMSFAEPFIAVGSSKVTMMALPILFAILMADFPKNGSEIYFLQIRTNRINWVVSQILFNLAISVTVVLFMLLGTVIMSIGMCNNQLKFSYPVTHFLSVYPDKYSMSIVHLLPGKLYNQMSAREALFHMVVFTILYLWILSLIMLLLTEWNKKGWGLGLAIVIVVLGGASTIVEATFRWVLPAPHTITWIHYQEYSRVPILPISTSYIYIAVLTTVLIIMCLLSKEKYELGR